MVKENIMNKVTIINKGKYFSVYDILLSKLSLNSLPLKYPSLGSGQSYDYAEPYSSFKESQADLGRGSYSDSRKLFLQKSGRILWIISCILVFLGMIAALGVVITLITADKSETKGSFNSDFVNKSGISLTTLIPDPVT
eukprot:XP_014770679.1 PREDICTED: uncharacterized protein LOC106869443 isoform X2 [Octopus bimaculoides]